MSNSTVTLVSDREKAARKLTPAIPLVSARVSEELLVVPRPFRQRSAGESSSHPRLGTRIDAWLGRALDIVGSHALLAFLLPVMVLLMIMIVASGNGPPVFAHRRVGRGGQPFDCYKFRSMCRDAESRLEAVLAEDAALRREWMQFHKLANDPRVTRLGRILRQTSLDELPQLFNVLRGDMSLVGPRPVVEDELERYGRFRSSYLSTKPGLTGLWQVTCRSESTYRRRVAIDRVYAKRKSLLLDIRILLATVPAVLSRKGAC